MKKNKNDRFGYYRVALCRGLGFKRITEQEFVDVYCDMDADTQTIFHAPYYLLVIKTEHRESCGVKCSDDYLYIRKRFRGK